VVESSPNGVVMVDRGGTIVLVNRETERLFGYTREELVGQPIERLVPERFRDGHPDVRQGFLKHPQTRAMGAGRDLFGIHKDGSEIPVEIGLNPIEAEEGFFVLASVIDIGPRKQAEAELRRSNEELERFAYVASHDLQEPLRKVASFCQLLQQRYGGQLDERADQYIGFAVDGAKRMQALINDLLAFSRVGRVDRPRELVDVDDLVEHATSVLSLAIEETGATVEVRGDLPEVLGERTLLGLVLQNLISNAIKFHGDEPPMVRVSARRDGERWEFAVADNGIGIDPEYADRIFVLFQRLHARDVYTGTGIGLTMCRKVVEYHGGEIWLEAGQNGGGSTFRFTLPVPDIATEETTP
jgi:PAS domain S-box-containing protein